ncbi:MAG: hypothetical protein ABIL62_05795 [Planctomycetota bacterium]
MRCYFCSQFEEAQGQCQNDGRFVCREHSRIQDGKLICIDCALRQTIGIGAEEDEKLYEYVMRELQSKKELILNESQRHRCGVCNRVFQLYNWFYVPDSLSDGARLAYKLLQYRESSVEEWLAQLFPDTVKKQDYLSYYNCPKGCWVCVNHEPEPIETRRGWRRKKYYYHVCRVCGEKF